MQIGKSKGTRETYGKTFRECAIRLRHKTFPNHHSDHNNIMEIIDYADMLMEMTYNIR